MDNYQFVNCQLSTVNCQLLMSVNKVILLGNVCQQPRIASFEGGGKSASFSLATHKRGYRTREGRDVPERTEFHNIVCGVPALVDVIGRYVRRGDRLYLEGELRTRQFKDQNQMVHYVTEVVVQSIELLQPRTDAAPGQPTQQPQQPQPRPAAVTGGYGPGAGAGGWR